MGWQSQLASYSAVGSASTRNTVSERTGCKSLIQMGTLLTLLHSKAEKAHKQQ